MWRKDQIVYIGLELVIACLAVVGNILVCWAVYLNSNLQNITNFFVVSLAVADIAVGLLAIPFAIAIRYHYMFFSSEYILIVWFSVIYHTLGLGLNWGINVQNTVLLDF